MIAMFCVARRAGRSIQQNPPRAREHTRWTGCARRAPTLTVAPDAASLQKTARRSARARTPRRTRRIRGCRRRRELVWKRSRARSASAESCTTSIRAAAVPLVVVKCSLSGDVKDAGPRVIDRTLRSSSRTTTRLDARSRTYLAKSFPWYRGRGDASGWRPRANPS